VRRTKTKIPAITLLLALFAGLFSFNLSSSIDASESSLATPAITEEEFSNVINGTNKKDFIIQLKDDKTKNVASPERRKSISSTQSTVISRNDALKDRSLRRLDNVAILSAQLDAQEVEDIVSDPLVKAVQENNLHFASLDDSTPLINADDIHAQGFDGTGFAVAILDTGVDSTHSFLNVIEEACYSNAGNFGSGTSLCPNGMGSQTGTGSGVNCDDAIPGCWHGTHVAGIATGNGVSFDGVAKGAGVIAIQVFTEYNDAGCILAFGYTPCLGATDFDIISALDRVLALEADADFTTPIASVNLSLGGSLFSSQSACDSAGAAYVSIFDDLRTAGIAPIVSSGNNGSSTSISAPACISSAIAVGSTTKSDLISSFSNSNSMLDLLAPGSSIQSSEPGGTFLTASGTSFSAPQVAGAWATLRQVNPTASVADILQALQDNGVPILDARNNITRSRIDLLAAHQALQPIIVTEIDTTTTEAAETAEVRFSLPSAPIGDVTIPLSIDDASEGTLNGITEIVIAMADWSTPANNVVIVTGVDDAIKDGNIAYNLVTGDPTSPDPNYDNLDANDVLDIELTNTDNDGLDEIGLKRNSTYYLNFDNAGPADTSFSFGRPTDTGLSGDWDGDGIDEIGLKRESVYFFTFDNTSGADTSFAVGRPTDQAIIGDWDGDGIDEIGLKRGNVYYLNFDNAGPADISFSFGKSSDLPISGDWDGDGIDEIGLKRGSSYYFSYEHASGADLSFSMGKPTDSAVVGDWDQDGIDEVGLKRGSTYYLNYDNVGPADISFPLGRSTDIALPGDWDGLD